MSSSLLQNVISAGTSAVLTVTCIHPIDVIKTRLQISGQGMRDYKTLGISGTIRTIVSKEGVRSFWKGIQPAWFREATYTSLRLGLYEPIKQQLGGNSFFMKFAAGSIAGGIGSLAGNPFDVMKTRMMSLEGTKMPAFTEQLRSIYREESFGGFYKGLQANVMRSVILNGTKMACYDQIKEGLETRMKPSIVTQFLSAFSAGFVMSVTVSPFDMIRTQLMSQRGQEYSGFIDCMKKIVLRKGIQGLYAGFLPIWFRFAPTTCLQLVLFEQIRSFYK